MTTQTIFFFAMGVFGLMLVGIVLTIIEFYRLTDDPSTEKGVGADQHGSDQSRDTQ